MHGSNLRSLAGRDDVLAAVLQSLRRPGGYGAVVAAETGLGKTAVGAAAARALNTETPVYWVYSSPALTAVPYGALAALLPDLAPEETGSPLAVMRALTARLDLHARPGRTPEKTVPVVIVDDAHDIDPPSLDLLAQLLDAGRIRLLILTRAFSDVSAVLPHMWDGQLSRHRLTALTEAETQQLCEEELQGQISATAAIELARLTGGNPMYLLALIEESVRSGVLLQRHGIWVLSDAGPPLGGRVGDLVKAQLRGLAAEDRATLESICLAEPLPLSVAFELKMHSSVDTLVELLLIQVVTEEDGRTALRPLHPLYGEVIRRMVPAARSSRLHKQLQEVLPGVCVGAEGLVRWVAWSLDLGAPVQADALLKAADAANNRSNPRLALRMADAAAGGPQQVQARIQKARALLQLGDADAAATAAAGTLEEAPDLESLKQAVMVEVRLSMGSAAGNGWAVGLAERWTRAVEHLPGVSAAEVVRKAHGGAQMLLLLGRVRDGDYAEAELEMAPALQQARESGAQERILFLEALTAEVLLATGRSRSALDHSRAAMAMLQMEAPGALLYRPFVLHRHLAALLWLGEWEEVRECVASADSPVQQTLLHLAGIADFALGLSRLRTNSLDAAIRHFTAAAEAAQDNDTEGLLRLSQALGSFAAGVLGQRELAGRLLRSAESTPPRGPLQYQLLAEGMIAGALAARDSDDASLQRLRDAADAAQERSCSAVEFTLRHLAFRIGDFSEAARLLKVSEGLEGPQAPVLNKVARAVVDQDVAALVELAAGPASDPEMDLLLIRQCLYEALRLARKGNDRALLNRIQRLVGRQGSGRTPLPELTRRERDVAALVAAGHRNAEIARQLNLSVRTVEGHIYRTYEKLGISRREELRARFPSLEDAAADWKPLSQPE
ncbi:LuxR C-terminal-related transcriptional regulator [Arthrobacter sp. YD2]|uniref:LuxR C-terminal-related transcriptional regulator n=1 Tax=Arthrobacter sp. YD2 TaxID=3058046 RepID=UPI0025B4317D|nr:LuxR C-terminal-related transcriptional regulator [Arthrobacter sp. YD2]MDN3905273.1 LuxR C-terminal-related transcriptional regulator [Arthrobacter sp. YD2]